MTTRPDPDKTYVLLDCANSIYGPTTSKGIPLGELPSEVSFYKFLDDVGEVRCGIISEYPLALTNDFMRNRHAVCDSDHAMLLADALRAGHVSWADEAGQGAASP